jgi:hypothetical protein
MCYICQLHEVNKISTQEPHSQFKALTRNNNIGLSVINYTEIFITNNNNNNNNNNSNNSIHTTHRNVTHLHLPEQCVLYPVSFVSKKLSGNDKLNSSLFQDITPWSPMKTDEKS